MSLLSNSARKIKMALNKKEVPEFDVDDEVLLMESAIVLDDDSDEEA
jgi:RNA polymerase nonessential primary-like sigma factor